jgi:hypothetical protein
MGQSPEEIESALPDMEPTAADPTTSAGIRDRSSESHRSGSQIASHHHIHIMDRHPSCLVKDALYSRNFRLKDEAQINVLCLWQASTTPSSAGTMTNILKQPPSARAYGVRLRTGVALVVLWCWSRRGGYRLGQPALVADVIWRSSWLSFAGILYQQDRLEPEPGASRQWPVLAMPWRPPSGCWRRMSSVSPNGCTPTH